VGLVPPLTGTAVKVTLAPAQVFIVVEVIFTDGVTEGLTVIVKVVGVPFLILSLTKLPSETGFVPTGIVAITSLVAVLTTETVLSILLVTYNLLPSEFIDTPTEPPPTGMVAISVLVAVLITETELSPSLATYTLLPSGLTDTPDGPEPLLN
jgi:hypothetical protein